MPDQQQKSISVTHYGEQNGDQMGDPEANLYLALANARSTATTQL
jgi:hypothetical protein